MYFFFYTGRTIIDNFSKCLRFEKQELNNSLIVNS